MAENVAAKTQDKAEKKSEKKPRRKSYWKGLKAEFKKNSLAGSGNSNQADHRCPACVSGSWNHYRRDGHDFQIWY